MLSPENSVTNQLCKGLEYGIQLLVQFRDLARVEFEFYAETSRGGDVRQAIQNLFARFHVEFKNLLDAGVANGEFRPMNTEALSTVLFGAYEGLAMQPLSTQTHRIGWPYTRA